MPNRMRTFSLRPAVELECGAKHGASRPFSTRLVRSASSSAASFSSRHRVRTDRQRQGETKALAHFGGQGGSSCRSIPSASPYHPRVGVAQPQVSW
jgi:hypothetical protein